jgi:hypothetical protein
MAAKELQTLAETKPERDFVNLAPEVKNAEPPKTWRFFQNS